MDKYFCFHPEVLKCCDVTVKSVILYQMLPIMGYMLV